MDKITDLDRLDWMSKTAGLPYEAYRYHGVFPEYFDADAVRDIIDAAINLTRSVD
jgi:hypothetical protein